MNLAGVGKKPVKPRCEECGRSPCHPYKMGVGGLIGAEASGSTNSYGFRWLCGDCKYKLDNPIATTPVPVPREQNAPLQEERLFDL
jgi:hypothetical protein